MKAAQRKRKKRIDGIESPTGEWHTKEESVAAVVGDYFSDVFTSANPSDSSINEVLECVEKSVTTEMNSVLLSAFTEDDIRHALFEMGSNKAPGPDGFHAAFYQHNWDLVGKGVTRMCLNVLNGDHPIEALNATLLCLIPKTKEPRQVSEYRPISLCNVAYKLITKTIVNGLKLVLGNIISENQSAFVPGHLISDNALVAFELMHALRAKLNGSKGWLALKLDMSKAYDRVELSFLEAIMVRLGFADQWIKLTWKCITTASFSCLING